MTKVVVFFFFFVTPPQKKATPTWSRRLLHYNRTMEEKGDDNSYRHLFAYNKTKETRAQGRELIFNLRPWRISYGSCFKPIVLGPTASTLSWVSLWARCPGSHFKCSQALTEMEFLGLASSALSWLPLQVLLSSNDGVLGSRFKRVVLAPISSAFKL